MVHDDLAGGLNPSAIDVHQDNYGNRRINADTFQDINASPYVIFTLRQSSMMTTAINVVSAPHQNGRQMITKRPL